MFCPKCGGEISPNDVVCAKCGSPLSSQVQAAAPAVPNHLVGAILVTLFCCLPFGIVSIVYAASVNGKVASGDIEGAQVASQKAMKWLKIAFILGIIAQVLNLVNVIWSFSTIA